MTSRSKGRLALAAFGALAIFAALTSVWEPAHWAIAVVGSYLDQSGPPPIVGGLRCTDLPRCAKATVSFDRIVKRRFPPGGKVKAMTDALAAQGFVLYPRPPDTMGTSWGHLPCSFAAEIHWTADANGILKSVDGLYSYGCS
jgi:hypothetical protein